MHSESVKLALYDIRDNVLLAREFVEGLACEGFSDSRLHIYAVTRALEIIRKRVVVCPKTCAIDILNCLGAPSGMLATSTGINMTTSLHAHAASIMRPRHLPLIPYRVRCCRFPSKRAAASMAIGKS